MMRSVLTWRSVIRRGWMLALGPIVGLIIGWAISGVAVSASSAYSVRTIQPGQNPYNSEQLAVTYSRLLPENLEVVSSIARTAHLSPEYVLDHFTMSTQPETNILYGRFTAGDASTAIAALRGFSRSIRFATDTAGTPLKATITPIAKPVVAGGFSRSKALLVGLLGGLMLSLTLFITLERRRPRVDELEDLASIVPVPVSHVDKHLFATSSETPDRLQEHADPRTPVPVEAVPALRSEDDDVFALIPTGILPVGTGKHSRALVVEQGATAEDVEETWRASRLAGASITSAFLVPRHSVPRRVRILNRGA